MCHHSAIWEMRKIKSSWVNHWLFFYIVSKFGEVGTDDGEMLSWCTECCIQGTVIGTAVLCCNAVVVHLVLPWFYKNILEFCWEMFGELILVPPGDVLEPVLILWIFWGDQPVCTIYSGAVGCTLTNAHQIKDQLTILSAAGASEKAGYFHLLHVNPCKWSCCGWKYIRSCEPSAWKLTH